MQTPFRHLLLLFAILLSASSLAAQNDTIIDGLKKRRNRESPCSRYWNGTMKYTTEPYLGVNILRKGKKQIETNTITGQKSIFKVTWDGNCAYTLKFKKSNMPSRFKKGWEVKYDIYACYEEYYEWEASIHGIMYWGQVTKELSKAEKKRKQKEAEYAAKKAHTDSLNAAREAMRTAKEDSIRKSKGLPTLAEEKAAKEKAAAQQPPAPAGNAEKEKGEGKSEKKEKKPKKEDGEAGEGEAKPAKEKKEKPEKPAKEKKEKPPKEKKEKAPKEKKEKPPKEEKPAKEESE
jgi:hypothetical protein